MLQGFRIIAPIGTGPEGARYRAADPSGRQVVLHFLHPTRIAPTRLTEIEERILVLSAVSGREVAPVIATQKHGERPTVAVADDSVKTLAEVLAQGLDRRTGAAIGLDLVRAVRRAHKLGLHHGSLIPFHVGLREDGSVCLDLTTLRTAEPPRRMSELWPTEAERFHPTLETDVYTLARSLMQLLGAPADAGPDALVRLALPTPVYGTMKAMLAIDPSERPTLAELVPVLAPFLGDGAEASDAAREIDRTRHDRRTRDLSAGQVLGRYRLLEPIGRGGIGEVFKAEELGTGRFVAVKVLRADVAGEDGSVRRFRREARLLGELRHPNIVELLEINEADGAVYMAMELVEGPSLSEYRRKKGKLPEREALEIMAAVARGLAGAHALGIVHRDIKPGNILLGTRAGVEPGSPLPFTVRLCDFGIARPLAETEETNAGDETNLTGIGPIGTPRFMAPEQCSGGGTPVSPASDVYAMGITLFDLLTGKNAYQAESTVELLHAHVHDVPLRADQVSPEVSAGAADLIERALRKNPSERPSDAAAFLAELENLLGGVSGNTAHPAIPRGTNLDDVVVVAHRFTLPASPRAVWPHVSNTERLNKAIGLPPVDWSFTPPEPGTSDGPKLFGEARQAGLLARWREHPFEWIEGQRLGVFREYSQGPLEWYVSAVELMPSENGGTSLTHRLWLKPRHVLARAAAWIEAKKRLKSKLERVYLRIGELAAKGDDAPVLDVFEGPRQPIGPEKRKLTAIGERMRAAGVSKAVVDGLESVLATAPDQEVARLRPIALARRLGLPVKDVIAGCLLGAKEGLLLPLWDVICPTCKIPSSIEDSLAAIRAHAFCQACSAGFTVDLARSVELVFRVHPSLRSAEVRTYCIGGPAHSPHAAVQLVLRAGERFTFDLALEEGPFELRTTREDWRAPFRVETFGGPSRMDVVIESGKAPSIVPVIRAGKQTFVVHNTTGSERVVRLERASPREDAFTAAEANIHPLFRQLFPEQTFRAGELISVESISLLVTDLHDPQRLYDELGEVEMMSALHRHLRSLAPLVEEGGGMVLKAQSHGIVAAFPRVEDAVATCAKLMDRARRADDGERKLPIIAAIHQGSAMAATVSDRVDYFGRTVTRTAELLQLAKAGQIVLGDRVAEEPGMEELWRRDGWRGEVVTLPRPQGGLDFAMRLDRPHQG